MELLTILSYLIFIFYCGYIITTKHIIPSSLSETFYILGGQNKLKSYLFTALMFALGFMLAPVTIELTNPTFQFIPMLMVISICFVGAAPCFKETYEGKVHSIAALVAAILAIIWVIFLTPCWFNLLLSSLICLLGSYITKSIKSSYIWWLEMIAFLSVFFTLIYLI